VIAQIDHLVITVRSVEETCSFYERVLGFERKSAPGKPTALHFGSCKISVHETDRTFEPKASTPTVGAADFCLITEWTLDDVARRLEAENVAIELGPVDRDGARGPIRSLYFRDPDGNLVEVSRYEPIQTATKRSAASSAAFGFAVAALLYH
jgi:catechol 2,3-dioxygenase-like lactoylglutathione lyase family enzyme